MTDRESAVVVALVACLLAATVLPFALPALRVGSPSASAGDFTVRDKSAPAAAPPPASPPSGETADDGLAGQSTGRPDTAWPRATRSTTVARTEACDPPATGGELPRRFPIGLGNREVTGENVSVAVLDPSGFDPDDPRIAHAVVATESFRATESSRLDVGGSGRHGTASAAVVSRIAPDAALYLANFETAYDFTRSVDWAIERDVDVIVAPVSFYAKPNDGTAPVSRAVTRATQRGIPVVVPVGNVADRHWEGTYTGGGRVEFRPGDTRLSLLGNDRPVQLWLWWNRSADDERHDFTVVLYRDRGNGDGAERIAASEDYPVGPVGTNQVLFEKIETNSLLSRTIENGRYFVRIEGPPDAAHRVELVAAAHRLDAPVRRGSLVAPATARGAVIAVGAADESTGRPLASSSRGPTNDGRRGIDLLAPGRAGGSNGPILTGTSAASAYTGGIVALLTAIDPTITPERAEAILSATADPVGADGPDLATGHGMIDPIGALDCAAGDGSIGEKGHASG